MPRQSLAANLSLRGTQCRGNLILKTRTVAFAFRMHGIASSGFALLAMTGIFSYLSLRGCLHPRQSLAANLSLRGTQCANATSVSEYCEAFMPVAISYLKPVQSLLLSHAWDCFVGLRPPRNDGYLLLLVIARVLAPAAISY